MDKAEIEALVRGSYATRQTNDIDAVMAYFHPEAEFRIVGSDALGPMSRPVAGHDGLRAMFAALLPEWDWSGFGPKSLHIDGNTVFVYSAGSIRHNPTGRVVTTEILDRVVIRDNLIVSFTEFLD